MAIETYRGTQPWEASLTAAKHRLTVLDFQRMAEAGIFRSRSIETRRAMATGASPR
jgi:hypothetical protein